jgi:hypothetical protein
MSTTTSYQQQIIREDPRIEAYKIGLIDEAKSLYETPLDLPAYEVAGQSAGQIQAADLLRQGIGAYEPFLQAGSQAVTQGQTLAQQGAQLAGGINVAPQFQSAQDALGRGLGAADILGGYAQTAGQGLQDILGGVAGIEQARKNLPEYMQGDVGTAKSLLGEAARGTRAASGSFTAPMTAQSYMSPYMQSVVDIQQREAQRQADIAKTQRAGQAVGAGAFGGSRQAVLEAEAARNLAQQKADIQAQGLQQSYMQGQQQFNVEQQAAAQRAAQMQGIAGTYGQLGLQQAQLGQAGTQLAGQLAGQQAQLGLMPAQLAQTQAGILGQQAGLYGQLGQGIGGKQVSIFSVQPNCNKQVRALAR